MKRIFLLIVGIAMLLFPMMLTAQTSTPTPDPEATPDVDDVVFVIEPSQDDAIDPPISITLPEGWIAQNGTVLIQDIIGLRLLPFTAYIGEINGGVGFIILLWGFESIGIANDLLSDEDDLVNSFLDGLRLLRLAVVEPQCNVGTDVQRDYRIGDKTALGTGFAAVNCPETADTRGWFAGLNVDGFNFAFYIFAEPIGAMDGAENDLQAILDTVEFHIDEFLATIYAEITPEPEITATHTP